MGNLGGTFDKRLKELGLKKQVDASMIVAEAQSLIKEKLGKRGEENLKAISFRRGVLKVAASNNVWAAECQGRVNFLELEKIEQTRYVIMPII